MILQVLLRMPRKKCFQHRKKAEKEKRSARQKVISSPPPNSDKPQLSSLQQMPSAIVFPTCEWSNHSPADMSRLQLCKIPQVCGNSSQPLLIAFNVIVNADLSWSLFVHVVVWNVFPLI